MIVFDSVRAFFVAIVSPVQELFDTFPEFGNIIKGIVILSLGYFGWRAVK